MNPLNQAVQTALQRVAMLKQALGGAVSGAGRMAGSVLDNYEQGFKNVDAAKNANIDQFVRDTGKWPGGLPQYTAENGSQGSDLGDFASKLTGLLGRIKKKL